MQIKKIESEEEIERKRKRNMIIMSVIMIGILLFSTAGYFTLSNDEDEGEEIVQNTGDSWIVRYGDQTFRLSNSPESAENVSMLASKTLDDYYGKIVYLASDSDDASYDLLYSLGRYTERMQPACYEECEKDLPEKSCNETMIVIKSKNLTGMKRVWEMDNCVFIEGDLEATDAFIYSIFGVI